MGRDHKKTVEFYPHFIGDGKKMFTIQTAYGNDGYATWNKLIELLAKTDNHFLDLSEESELMFVASYCHVSTELLLRIVNDICKLKEIDKELWENQIIWNQKFIESIQSAYAKRKNPCITRDQLVSMFISSKRLEKTFGIDLNEQKKVSKSKKESKDSYSDESHANVPKFSFSKELEKHGVSADNIHVWLQIRKQKRASNSEIALNGFLREVRKTDLTVDEVVIKCIERSWSGFEATWIEKTTTNNTPKSNVTGNNQESREQALRQFGTK